MLNSARLPMLQPFRICWAILLCLSAISASAQSFNKPVADLISKVETRAGAGTAVHLSVRNRSSLNAGTAAQIRTLINAEAQRRGWKLTNSEDSVDQLAITLSENARDYVWTAELNQGGTREVFFTSFAKPEDAAPTQSSALTLNKTLLVASDSPLLDAAIIDPTIQEGARLLLLHPGNVELLNYLGGHWQSKAKQDIAQAGTWPRDLRGRLRTSGTGDGFEVFLPGTRCNGTAADNGVGLACSPSDDPWPLTPDGKLSGFYAVTRNFFTGALSGDLGRARSVAPFFAAAPVGPDIVLFSGIDGKLRAWSVSGQQTYPLKTQNYGSEIAALSTNCSAGPLVLTTRPGDLAQADAVTAMRYNERDLIPAAAPMTLPGGVATLSPSSDQRTAIVITTSDGHYEAYLLTAACGS